MQYKQQTEVAKLAELMERAKSACAHHQKAADTFIANILNVRAAIEAGTERPANGDKLRSVDANVSLWMDRPFDEQARAAVIRQLATHAIKSPEAIEAARREFGRRSPPIPEPSGPLHEKLRLVISDEQDKNLPVLIGSLKSCLHARLRRHDVIGSVGPDDNVFESVINFSKTARCASTWIDLAGLHGVTPARGAVPRLFRRVDWQAYPRYVQGALDRALERDKRWAEIADQVADDHLIALIEMREQLKEVEPDASEEQRKYARQIRATAVILGVERTIFGRLSAASSIIDRLAPITSERRKQRSSEPEFPGREMSNRKKPSDMPPRPRRSFLRPCPQTQA